MIPTLRSAGAASTSYGPLCTDGRPAARPSLQRASPQPRHAAASPAETDPLLLRVARGEGEPAVLPVWTLVQVARSQCSCVQMLSAPQSGLCARQADTCLNI